MRCDQRRLLQKKRLGATSWAKVTSKRPSSPADTKESDLAVDNNRIDKQAIDASIDKAYSPFIQYSANLACPAGTRTSKACEMQSHVLRLE